MQSIPEFSVLKSLAEEKLGNRLGGPCRIELIQGYNAGVLEVVKAIDNQKFRKELWYSGSEIESRMKKQGFLCFLVYHGDTPIAFEYGYNQSDGIYFSDSEATLIEGKGIGTTLFALEILYLYQRGYEKVMLSTEEVDEQGRTLRSFWESMGFVKLGENEDGNVDMLLVLSDEVAQHQYERYIKPR